MGLIKLTKMFSRLTKVNLVQALELTKITGWTSEVTDKKDSDWYSYMLTLDMAGEKIKGVWFKVIDEPDKYVFAGIIGETGKGLTVGLDNTGSAIGLDNTGSVIGELSGGYSVATMLVAQTLGDIIKFFKLSR